MRFDLQITQVIQFHLNYFFLSVVMLRQDLENLSPQFSLGAFVAKVVLVV